MNQRMQYALRLAMKCYGGKPFSADALVRHAEQLADKTFAGAELRIALLELSRAQQLTYLRRGYHEYVYAVPSHVYLAHSGEVWPVDYDASCVNMAELTCADLTLDAGETAAPALSLQLLHVLAELMRTGGKVTRTGTLLKKTALRAQRHCSVSTHGEALIGLPRTNVGHLYPYALAFLLDLAAQLGILARRNARYAYLRPQLTAWLALSTSAREASLLHLIVQDCARSNPASLRYATLLVSLPTDGSWQRLSVLTDAYQLEEDTARLWVEFFTSAGWTEQASSRAGDIVVRSKLDASVQTALQTAPAPGADVSTAAHLSSHAREHGIAAQMSSPTEQGIHAQMSSPTEQGIHAQKSSPTEQGTDAQLSPPLEQDTAAAAQNTLTAADTVSAQRQETPLANSAHPTTGDLVDLTLNGELYLSPAVSGTHRLLAELLAERKQCDIMTIYELTENSIKQVKDKLTLQELTDLLTRITGERVPKQVCSALRAWYQDEEDLLFSQDEEERTAETDAFARDTIPPLTTPDETIDTHLLCTLIGGSLAENMFVCERLLLFNRTTSGIPEIFTHMPPLQNLFRGIAEVPVAWHSELRAYHHTTRQKILEQALHWQIPVTLQMGEAQARFIPTAIDNSSAWHVRGHLDGTEIELTPAMWQAMRLDVPSF